MSMTNQKDNSPTNVQRDNNDGAGVVITTSDPPPQPDEGRYNGMLHLSLATMAPPLLIAEEAATPPQVETAMSMRRTQLGRGQLQTPPPTFKRGSSGKKKRQQQQRGKTTHKNQGPEPVLKSETIPPPFEWATDRRARVHTLNHLLSRRIEVIKGEVQCKRCEQQYVMEFDLQQKFEEVGRFLTMNKAEMRERAPDSWLNPKLPACRHCRQENSAKPVIGSSKKSINWLFLLLGQMVGCCTLDQLRYFCKHTRNHRTGAKDRVLYLTYLTLCKQLDPTGPFDR